MPSLLSWRSMAASVCFLLGAAFLAMFLVSFVSACNAMATRSGSVSPNFIFAISGINAAIGTIFLRAGVNTINRQDGRALRCIVAAIIILGLGFAFVMIQ